MAKYPDIQIVFKPDGPLTRERGVKQARMRWRPNPDLAAIYTANDDVALGASRRSMPPTARARRWPPA